MKYNSIAAAVAFSLSVGSGFVQAQQNTAQDKEQKLETITVYGEKKVKDIQDTPVSVAVLTEADLEVATIQTFNDIFSRMANVSSERGGNETLFAIRGISVQGVSDNPNSYTAGVYIDDIPLDNLAVRYGVMGVWDAQQVEVYRGPQATLQGRNSLNGAVYIRTNDPTFDWNGKAQLYYGSYNTKRFSVAAGGPLIDDELAFRFSVDRYQSDSYVDNITRGEDDYAGFERTTVRAKVLWQPSAIEDLSVLLTFANIDNDMGASQRVGTVDPYSFEAFSDHPASNDIEADMASLKISYDISENLSFTSITTYNDDKYVRIDDFDSSALAGNYIDQTGDSNSVGQEFRLNFDFDKVSGVAGIYYSELDRDAFWDLRTLYPKAQVEGQVFGLLTAPTSVGGMGLDMNTATAIWNYVPTLIDVQQLFDSNYKIDNTAIFGEATWQTTDKWSVTVGARYDDESQKRNQNTVTSILERIPVDNSFPPLTVIASTAAQQLLMVLESQLQGETENVDTSYQVFLPKFSVQYAYNEDVNLAFTTQRGYRAGGSSVNLATSDVIEFDPEYTWNYELSLRSVFPEHSLRFNANIFYTDWNDQQVDVSPTGDRRDTYVGNAGESELYGAELEFSGNVDGNLDWFTNIGYVKTNYESFPIITRDGLQDFSGNEFFRAPNLTVSSGANYRFDNGMFVFVDANYQDEAYLDNANTRESDARVIVNAKIGYEESDWGAYFWVTNLLDKEYLVTYNPQDVTFTTQDNSAPGAPRMLGVSLTYAF